MSGKLIFSIVALTLLAAAVYIFYNRHDTGVLVQELQNQPKVSLFQFEFYRTKDDVETSRLVGNNANLMEGGVLHLRGGARGFRIREERREQVSGNSADIFLSGSTPGQLAGDIKVSTAKVYENVEVLIDDTKLESQMIEFSEAESNLKSNLPVRVTQKNQFLAGEGGFEYGIAKQTVKIRGGVTGTLLPKEVKERSKRGKSE